MSAAENPDPTTSRGAPRASSLAMGASRGGGGMLTVKVPEASTRCLQRMPSDPMMNPPGIRYTPLTLMPVKTESEMPTASG